MTLGLTTRFTTALELSLINIAPGSPFLDSSHNWLPIYYTSRCGDGACRVIVLLTAHYYITPTNAKLVTLYLNQATFMARNRYGMAEPEGDPSSDALPLEASLEKAPGRNLKLFYRS